MQRYSMKMSIIKRKESKDASAWIILQMIIQNATRDACNTMHGGVNKIHEWSTKWEMEFDIQKFHFIKFGKSKMRPIWNNKLGKKRLKNPPELDSKYHIDRAPWIWK